MVLWMKIESQTFGATFSVPKTIFVPVGKWVLIHSVYMLPTHTSVVYWAAEKMRVMAVTTLKEGKLTSASLSAELFLASILLTSGVVRVWNNDSGSKLRYCMWLSHVSSLTQKTTFNLLLICVLNGLDLTITGISVIHVDTLLCIRKVFYSHQDINL